MIPALIVAGIILFICIVLSLIGFYKARKNFCFYIKEHAIEVKTSNLFVKLLVDGEERDKTSFNIFKWYNATLTTVIDVGTIIVRIKRKYLIGSPKLNITLNDKTLIFIFQNKNNASC